MEVSASGPIDLVFSLCLAWKMAHVTGIHRKIVDLVTFNVVPASS